MSETDNIVTIMLENASPTTAVYDSPHVKDGRIPHFSIGAKAVYWQVASAVADAVVRQLKQRFSFLRISVLPNKTKQNVTAVPSVVVPRQPEAELTVPEAIIPAHVAEPVIAEQPSAIAAEPEEQRDVPPVSVPPEAEHQRFRTGGGKRQKKHTAHAADNKSAFPDPVTEPGQRDSQEGV